MIVGFGFTKLSAQRNEAGKGKIDINNNVTIKDVQESDISLGKDKQGVIKFVFEFTSKYEPNVGAILFEGELLYNTDKMQHTGPDSEPGNQLASADSNAKGAGCCC